MCLKMISMSGEFDNIQSRENEAQELHRLRDEAVVFKVEEKKQTAKDNDGGDGKEQQKIVENHTKTNILLQSYISRARVEDFALVSDTAYVAQNAARICRALFMIALNRGWGHQCLMLLSMCKAGREEDLASPTSLPPVRPASAGPQKPRREVPFLRHRLSTRDGSARDRKSSPQSEDGWHHLKASGQLPIALSRG